MTAYNNVFITDSVQLH